jgi:hypothetical protein
MLELGEELFDRIEIRGVLGQEEELGAGSADGVANSFSADPVDRRLDAYPKAVGRLTTRSRRSIE